MALARRHEGGSELGDLAQARIVVRRTRRGGHAPETRRRKSPAPSASIEASQSRNDAASMISPASTAHSMPLE